MENEIILSNIETLEDTIVLRGRITNKNIIYIPENIKELVEETNITASLTPVGSHQNIIIKRINNYEIHLQSNGGLPVDCFYHIFLQKKVIEE
jgi:hypothetical protein